MKDHLCYWEAQLGLIEADFSERVRRWSKTFFFSALLRYGGGGFRLFFRVFGQRQAGTAGQPREKPAMAKPGNALG